MHTCCKLSKIAAIVIAGSILLMGCNTTANTGVTAPSTVQPFTDTFTSIPVKLAPHLDGSGDDLAWQVAPARSLDVTTNGIKPFKLTLKSVYDADSVYFLVQYPDINKDVIRSAWAYNAAKSAWERLGDDVGDEDEFGFFWNVNVPNYQAAGCAAFCHAEDPNNQKMYTTSGTWVDIWQWNATRTNPMGWARDMRLTDNPNANTDPAGGFVEDEGSKTNPGYADNIQTLNGKDVPLYWKPYSGASGIVAGDAIFLLQSEIDAGLAKKIVQIDASGTLMDEAGNRVPWYSRIPGRILSVPSGPSWNDVKASGAWHDGVWTIELSRRLNTGHVDDVQFDPSQTYYFDIYIKTRQAGEVDRQIVSVSKFAFGK